MIPPISFSYTKGLRSWWLNIFCLISALTFLLCHACVTRFGRICLPNPFPCWCLIKSSRREKCDRALLDFWAELAGFQRFYMGMLPSSHYFVHSAGETLHTAINRVGTLDGTLYLPLSFLFYLGKEFFFPHDILLQNVTSFNVRFQWGVEGGWKFRMELRELWVQFLRNSKQSKVEILEWDCWLCTA